MTIFVHYHKPRLSQAYQNIFDEYQREIENIYQVAMIAAEEHASQTSPGEGEEIAKMRKLLHLNQKNSTSISMQ